MDSRERLIRLWMYLNVRRDVVRACAEDYDLLCPHCSMAGRGPVHLKLLPDDSGFRCMGIGHEYRWRQSRPSVRNLGGLTGMAQLA
jgi:hypothetical protein